MENYFDVKQTGIEVQAILDAVPNKIDKEEAEALVSPISNKPYNTTNFSGLGRVNLEKNILDIEGTSKNVLTQDMFNKGTVGSRVPNTNTIFVIQYDYDLNGETITIPEDCVLEFDGGSLSNGAVKGDNIEVVNKGGGEIFKDVVLSGLFLGTANDSFFSTPSDYDDNGDYLILHNLLQFENAEIVKRKTLDIKTWINPYVGTYSFVGKSIKCKMLSINGNGCIVKLLVAHEAPNSAVLIEDESTPCIDLRIPALSTCKKPFAREDANNFAWGVPLTAHFIAVSTADTIINVRNISFVSDESLYGAGEDLSADWPVFILPNGTVAQKRSRGYFINCPSLADFSGVVQFDDVSYRNRDGFMYATASSTESIKTDNALIVDGCGFEVTDGFVFELWRSSGTFAKFGYAKYANSYFSALNKTDILNSNSSVVESVYDSCTFRSVGVTDIDEHFNNCVISNGVVSGENCVYRYNNCKFINVSVNNAVNSNVYTAYLYCDNCVFTEENLNPITSYGAFRTIAGRTNVEHHNCTFDITRSCIDVDANCSAVFEKCVIPSNIRQRVTNNWNTPLQKLILNDVEVLNGRAKKDLYPDRDLDFPMSKDSFFSIKNISTIYGTPPDLGMLESAYSVTGIKYFLASLQSAIDGVTIADGYLSGATSQKDIPLVGGNTYINRSHTFNILLNVCDISGITLTGSPFFTAELLKTTDTVENNKVRVSLTYDSTEKVMKVAYRINEPNPYTEGHGQATISVDVKPGLHWYTFSISDHEENLSGNNKVYTYIDGEVCPQKRAGYATDVLNNYVGLSDFNPDVIRFSGTGTTVWFGIKAIVLQSFGVK